MKKKDLKFVFFGTPEVASKTLEILKINGYLPSLIITATDKREGRKMILTPPPVKTWAIENNIPFIQPNKINNKELYNVLRTLDREGGNEQKKFSEENFCGEQNIIEFFRSNFDLVIVVAYGKILPEEILNLPKLGSINIHYSLLPKYRGASPVESAILNGDKITGVCIQQMQYKMDSGPILAKKEINIDDNDTAEILKTKLIKLGGELLIEILPNILNRKINKEEQDEEKATFCKKIKKEDGEVDLEKENPIVLYNKYRAYHKWPRTFFFQNNKRIIISDARLEDEKFIIKKVIPEGKKEISYELFLKKIKNKFFKVFGKISLLTFFLHSLLLL